MPNQPSPALRTLADHCRSVLSGKAVSGRGHSEDVQALARRHRVVGLHAAATGDVVGARQVVAANLLQAAECARLSRLLADNRPLFLKGLTVAALGYPEPLLKQSADIDLLVDEREAADAAAKLEGGGYRRVMPEGDRSLARWYKVSNQSVWVRGDVAVELHVRPLTVPFEPTEPTQQVVIAEGIVTSTYGDKDLYVYLVQHGALSGWFRLKWLADLYAFLAKRWDNIDAFHAAAEARGAGPASAAALLLLGALFDTPIPAGAAKGKSACSLLALSLGLLEGPEPTETIGGTMAIHRAYFTLRPGPRSLAQRGIELLGQRLLR